MCAQISSSRSMCPWPNRHRSREPRLSQRLWQEVNELACAHERGQARNMLDFVVGCWLVRRLPRSDPPRKLARTRFVYDTQWKEGCWLLIERQHQLGNRTRQGPTTLVRLHKKKRVIFDHCVKEEVVRAGPRRIGEVCHLVWRWTRGGRWGGGGDQEGKWATHQIAVGTMAWCHSACRCTQCCAWPAGVAGDRWQRQTRGLLLHAAQPI